MMSAMKERELTGRSATKDLELLARWTHSGESEVNQLHITFVALGIGIVRVVIRGAAAATTHKENIFEFNIAVCHGQDVVQVVD